LTAICAALLAGCAAPRAPIPSIQEQISYIETEDLVDREDRLARKLVAQSFLRLSPADRTRFNLQIMDLRLNCFSGCNLKAMAEADIKAGHLNLLLAGDSFMPRNQEQELWDRISRKYGISSFQFGHGGTEGALFYELIGVYSKVVEQEIKRKFGKSSDEIFLKERQALELR
jgi:hypothetical protein